jgi:RimJ/RimL family protein N-acetyltransferase
MYATRVPLPYSFDEPLVTDRLSLRLMTEDDVDAVHDWMSDPEVVRYQLYDVRDRSTVAEKVAEYALASRLERNGDYVQPAIVVDGEVVGAIYFTLSSVDDLTAEIGWALRRQYQGKGYAIEAARAMLSVAFGEMGLHRVYAELDPRNAASVALCLRLGMRHEAHFVEHMMFKGEWADTGIYGLLAREWIGLGPLAPLPPSGH